MPDLQTGPYMLESHILSSLADIKFCNFNNCHFCAVVFSLVIFRILVIHYFEIVIYTYFRT